MEIGLENVQSGFLQIHPGDNVLVALKNLPKGKEISYGNYRFSLSQDVPAKHKFTVAPLEAGAGIYMYVSIRFSTSWSNC